MWGWQILVPDLAGANMFPTLPPERTAEILNNSVWRFNHHYVPKSNR